MTYSTPKPQEHPITTLKRERIASMLDELARAFEVMAQTGREMYGFDDITIIQLEAKARKAREALKGN